MEVEEDDDFYGGGTTQDDAEPTNGSGAHGNNEQMDDDDEEEEEDEDDIEFTLERPEGVKPEPATRPSIKPTPSHDRTVSQDVKPKASTPAIKPELSRTGSTAPPQPTAVKGTLTYNGKEGKDYPETRTSELDLKSMPNWPNPNKPLIELDIDADLAENSKPWRLPGTDITDFFNYGFDEYTWVQYCMEQRDKSNTINDLKKKDAEMKAMFGGGPPGGMPDMPPGMMEQMMQMMGGQGGMPGMDMMQMGGMPGMPPGMGGFGGGGGQGGSGNNSPAQFGGQGFQPPQGPGVGFDGGMGMMGDQGMGGQQGGGRGGRNRRGRW